MTALATVRRTGARAYPWEARCHLCTPETLHFPGGGIGAVAINTHGIGNPTWALAMRAVQEHLRLRHPTALQTPERTTTP